MTRHSSRSSVIRLAVAVGIGVLLWWIPIPDGVTPPAWHLLAIFVATIVAIILEPLPMGAIAILGLTATMVTGTLAEPKVGIDPAKAVIHGGAAIGTAGISILAKGVLDRLGTSESLCEKILEQAGSN